MLLWFVIIYWIISIGIGLWAALRVKNTADFAVAGHSLPLPIVTATVFATWFGSETVLGIPATFLKEGLGGIVSDPFGSSLCLILVGIFFAKHLYNRKMLTIGDFFREKYGRTVEVLVTLCIVASYLGWVAAQIKALGLVFNVVSEGGVSQTMGMLIGAGSVLIYTLFGGMWSVAIGMLYIGGEMAIETGGIGVVIEHAAAAGKLNFWPELNLAAILGFMAALFTMMLGSIPQQDVFQRIASSKNSTIAVRAAILGGVLYFIFAFIPLFLAYSASLLDPDLIAKYINSDPQLILPKLIINHAPLFAQIMFFGALLSAIKSCASATLLAPSVTFAENIVRGFYQHLTDHQLLKMMRITVLCFTVIVTMFAINSELSIFKMVESAYKITLVSAFMAVVFGLVVWIACEIFAPRGIVPPQLAGLFASLAGMLIGGWLPNSVSQYFLAAFTKKT
jgi:Na+/proline symporter